MWKKSMNIVLYITLRDTGGASTRTERDRLASVLGVWGLHGVRRSSEDQARV
jgi:hypothetical protein